MINRMTLTHKVQQLLDPYDSSHTECDGMTRICHTVLTQLGIEHQPMVGTLAVLTRKQLIPLHLWIDLPNGYKIDYRARMWLGDEKGVPHGVFHPQHFPVIVYTGAPIQLQPLPPVLFEILTLKEDWGKFKLH